MADKTNEYLRRVKEIIYLCKESENSEEWQYGQKLQRELKDRNKQVIWPVELYCRCAILLYDNPAMKSSSRVEALEYGQQVYAMLFPQGQETPDYEALREAFECMFAANGAIARKCFNATVFNLFNDKRNYIKWMQGVCGHGKYAKVMRFCTDYGVEARGYYPQEESFTANFIYVCNVIISASDAEKAYADEVRKVEHMAGIYEVDEATIMEAEQQLAAAKATVDRARDILNVLDTRSKSIDSMTEHAVERVKQLCESEVELALARVNEVDTQLRTAYDKFLDTQRKRVLMDKKQLVDEVIADTEGYLKEFKLKVKDVLNMAKLDMAKINRESGDIMAKVETFIKDESRLNELIKSGEEHADIMKKLEKLTLLNDRNIEYIEKNIEKAAADDSERQQAAAAQGWDEKPETDVIAEVNPLLDESIEFKKRFDNVMKAKKEMEKKGEHFHKMFDDVLIAIMENANPYLIGPSGCGKTYMVNQIARILDMSFIDIGYINEEYDILGFQTANGGYSRPNFYRCYKYGKIAFCDELDNGNSRATVKLNSFLSNTKNAGYSFPHGEHVRRHPNFRIIAAGNTAGNGADGVYNTREKIEESVQQRFTPIYVGYDNEVERAILGDYSDWYEFIVLFRNATDAWSEKSHSAAPGIVTTRDAARIKKYIDNGSFDTERILDYEFIQTKDEGYLAFLAEHIKKNMTGTNPGAEIAKEFIRKVELIRNNDTRR